MNVYIGLFCVNEREDAHAGNTPHGKLPTREIPQKRPREKSRETRRGRFYGRRHEGDSIGDATLKTTGRTLMETEGHNGRAGGRMRDLAAFCRGASLGSPVILVREVHHQKC